MISRLIIFLLFFCSVFPLKADHIFFYHYSTANGLSENFIHSIVQDDLGYIWFGTINGLNRFDGHDFKVYKPEPGTNNAISSNFIALLAAGKNGNIWALSNLGDLNYYNAEKEQFIIYPDSLLPQRNTIFQMLEEPNGNLLLNYRNALAEFNPVTRTYTLIDSISSNMELIQVTPSIVGIRSTGKIQFYDISINGLGDVKPENFVIPNKTFACTSLGDEIIYVTKDGCFSQKFNHTEKKKYFNISGLSGGKVDESAISQISFDREKFWIIADEKLFSVTSLDGKYIFSSHEVDANKKGSLVGELPSFLFQDKINNTWIVTLKTGVNVYSKSRNRFKFHYIPQKFEEDYTDPVRAIYPLENREIMVGFDHSGLGKITDSESKSYFIPLEQKDSENVNEIRSIFRDSEESIWYGSLNGIFIFNEISGQSIDATTRFKLPDLTGYRVIKEFKKGELYLGGNGITRFNLKSQQSQTIVRKKLGNNIRDLEMDDEGFLWIASDNNGVFCINPDTREEINHFSTSTTEIQITNDKVYCLAKTPDKLWIGTHNGLNIIDLKERTTVHLYEKNGLSENVIYGILPDDLGNVWVSTSKGLNRINVSTLEIKSYLPDFYFMDDAFVKGKDGKLYFGGYHGFVSLDPKNFNEPAFIPQAFIHTFRIFNEEVKPDGTYEGEVLLDKPLYKIDSLQLNYKTNTFSFGFNAQPVLIPNELKYRYMLQGYDDRWIYANNENRSAAFTNVPPGVYTLKINTSLSDGEWGKVEKQLVITITPPFWEETWFRILLAGVVIVMLISFYYYRLSQIKKLNVYLKNQVEIQTARLKDQNKRIVKQKDEMVSITQKLHETDQAKLNIFTTISHEFRTPLTLILGHLDMLIHAGKGNKIQQKSIGVIKGNAQRLLRMVNQLIEIRKNDQQKSSLNISGFKLVEFCQEILSGFEALAKKKNINLQLFNFLKENQIWLDREKTEHILYNLLSNAIKYTPENGQVALILEEKKNTISIILKDDGIGIPKSEQPFIFDSFFRSKNESRYSPGHGIGLTLVKSFVEQMLGDITLESEEGKGSKFTLTFKKGKDHFPLTMATDNLLESSTIPLSGNEKWKELPSARNINIPLATILVVEDHKQLREYVKDIFVLDYQVEEVSNGKEALSFLEKQLPDLIISDIMMPEMDGIALCKTLKENQNTAHIPIILLTAKGEMETKIESFDLGVNDYIEKPFDARLLQTRVNALLKNRELMKKWINQGILNSADLMKIKEEDRVFIQKVSFSMIENLGKPEFSIESLGDQLGMSRSTFYRKFKKLTGISANEYLKKIRLGKAKALLEEGNVTISQICFEVGYQSQAQFRVAFKNEFGDTPSKFKAVR
ncbi:hybrid sensor histidine kinase/response regulator transcription factor [Flexithrix dorotheae]|uniref:hybrid sensor histidine kinase/response regulator transcription factor n=1 Tax=Flexithrix dorotheae TaxID=70993 RepID=UPI0003A4BB98|nr:response regulator [Flexithrix dorotheae]